MSNEEYVEIQDLGIEEVKPYGNNPRVNSNAVESVKKSISKFGFLVPLVVDEDNVIIAGHTRYLAARELGLETIPVIRATHLTPDEAKAFRLADNRVSENASWDQNRLAEELQALRDIGFDMSETGFSLEEIDCLIDPLNADCLDDLSQQSVCGDIEPVFSRDVNFIMMSIGLYRVRVTREAYEAWDAKMLEDYGSSKAISEEIARRLGFSDESGE